MEWLQFAPAIISAIAQIFGSKREADQKTDAARAAIAAQLSMFGIGQQALQPYLTGGASAMNLLMVGTPGHAAIPAHWKTAKGKVVSVGPNFEQQSAVRSVWTNPQGQQVKMPPTWKPGPNQQGWKLVSAGRQLGHATASKWIGPNGQVVAKAWNWQPPKGQESHWKLQTKGTGPTVGWKQLTQAKAAVAGKPGMMGELLKPIELDQKALEKTPGYKFALSQGLGAVGNALTARGLDPLGSGAGIKGAEQFATGLASQTYQQQFQNAMANKEMAWRALYGTASLGESAATGIGTAAATAGSNIAGNLVGIGDAQAGSTAGIVNAITGLANSANVNNLIANAKNQTGVTNPGKEAFGLGS